MPGWNIDISLEIRDLVDGREQRRRRDVIAKVNRYIANHPGKRSADIVISELLFLGVGQRLVGFVVSLGVLIGLSRLIVRILRNHACFKELALAIKVNFGVIVHSLLLRLGSLLRLHRRDLLQRINCISTSPGLTNGLPGLITVPLIFHQIPN